MLWWVANVLLSLLAIAVAYYDGVVLAFVVWFLLFLILMVFRPT